MSDDNTPIILDISGRISLESEEMEQVPASGIYLNSDDDERKTHVKDAIIDDAFPEVVHFEVVRDIENREAFDKFLELRDRIKAIAADDIEYDFEIYDELFSTKEESLVLHIVVENQEISEIYGTIEYKEILGEIDEVENEFDSGDRDFTKEEIQKFERYIEDEDKSNIRVLPLSILDSYFKSYEVSDWENTALRETLNLQPYWPIHVEH